MSQGTADTGRDALEAVAERWRWFARFEAQGRSRLYAEIAHAVSADAWSLGFLAQMPEARWQPNLLLATVRYLYGTPEGPTRFLELVRSNAGEIAAVMAVRSTQTNEPARCSVLLPALARLPPPLALLEVGASAGLCLLPDRYAYDYGRRRIDPSVPSRAQAPTFVCRATPDTPLPERNLEISWRAGLDLHPIDLDDEAEVRWLHALVWPGEEDRAPRLNAACEIAREDPPVVIKGDLRKDLPALAATAPRGATLVVFHTAVLAYVSDSDERDEFARGVSELDAIWIANEAPENIPGTPAEIISERPHPDALLLAVDGRPTAWTDGHGSWLAWRPDATRA
jgi:hypothetical protein